MGWALGLLPGLASVVRTGGTMTRSAVCVASVAVMCLTVSSEARAEPVRITGGVLDFNGALGSGVAQAGLLSIVGTRGFSADGLVDSTETRIDPIGECVFDCQPGSTISVGANVGSGFSGRATLDGQTYSDVGFNSSDFLALDLSGTIGIPAWQNAPVSISAPFDASGFFRHVDFSGTSSFEVPIRGGGTATLNLLPEPAGTWALGTFRYDFVATATPEPTTLTMVGAPLVAALIRARKRRDGVTTIQVSTSTPSA